MVAETVFGEVAGTQEQLVKLRLFIDKKGYVSNIEDNSPASVAGHTNG
jgi:hypothetical protein